MHDPQIRTRMEDDFRICPCRPFYGVIHGVSPRIRVSYRIHVFAPSEGRFLLFSVSPATESSFAAIPQARRQTGESTPTAGIVRIDHR